VGFGLDVGDAVGVAKDLAVGMAGSLRGFWLDAGEPIGVVGKGVRLWGGRSLVLLSVCLV